MTPGQKNVLISAALPSATPFSCPLFPALRPSHETSVELFEPAAAGAGTGNSASAAASPPTTHGRHEPLAVEDLDTQANPLDVAFTDSRHGYLVGSNRMIRETSDGGAHWNERSLDLPDDENFRLIGIDFDGDEGWIARQPGLLMHSDDGGQNWTRLFLDTKLPGEPYLITALGSHSAELATNVGAVYETHNDGNSWEAKVTDAAGAVRDLRRSKDGSYVSVSGLGNFYATWSRVIPSTRCTSG